MAEQKPAALDKLLTEAQSLCDAATPGEWRLMETPPPSYSDHGWRSLVERRGWMVGCEADAFLRVDDTTRRIGRNRSHEMADLRFIARARTLIPELIAALRAAPVPPGGDEGQ